ncbi:MAG TPA: hypothetical protein EYN67_09230 [Flavobacteriales bacterium]|nr:hypothetical protein [Flavobacteriales bacterium]
MNTEEVETPHQDGPAWKIVGKFPTFELADSRRNELATDDDTQVKVHWQGTAYAPYFAVKQRPNPMLAAAETEKIRKEDKKKRKAKLNKKRRKK